jgi:hypothetical protein
MERKGKNVYIKKPKIEKNNIKAILLASKILLSLIRVYIKNAGIKMAIEACTPKLIPYRNAKQYLKRTCERDTRG